MDTASQISNYVGEIAGRTFPSNYFYDPFEVNGNGTYDGTVTSYGANVLLYDPTPSSLSGTIESVDSSKGLFSLDGVTYQAYAASADGNTLLFGSPVNFSGQFPFHASQFHVLSNTGQIPDAFLPVDSSDHYNIPLPTCFAAGTMILTDRGEVSIERLREGDVVLTAEDIHMPIRWIGRRFVRCSTNPWKKQVYPVRIERHAFALGIPHRPLLVSPGHSLLVDDNALLQAEFLLNDKTISQVEVEDIMYLHIELERHAVLIANGLAAESFLDVGNRRCFDNGSKVVELHPQLSAEGSREYCITVVADPIRKEIYREKFACRAEALEKALLRYEDVSLAA